jgi:hypothetical protein
MPRRSAAAPGYTGRHWDAKREEAPSRLPWHNPDSEAFLRYFQPSPDSRFYAGVDLHARSLFLVVLDRVGPPSPHVCWVRLVRGVRSRVCCR